MLDFLWYTTARVLPIRIITIPNIALLLMVSFNIILDNIVVNTTLRKSNGATRLILPLLNTHIRIIFAVSNTMVTAVRYMICSKVIVWGFIRT